MRRHPLPVLLVLVAAQAAATSGTRHDVNGDGRFDRADVQALALMVAGLEPVDLRFDQNDDGLLSMADVEALSEALEGGRVGSSGPEAASAPPETPAPAGEVPFLVVREAGSGTIVVAVGGAGVRVGDRILGVYGTLSEAEAARKAFLAGGPPAPAPPAATPAAEVSPPTQPVDPAEAAPSVPELRGTVAAVPLGSGRALFIAPGWRDGWLLNAIGDGSRANLVHQDLGPLGRWKGQFGIPAPVFHTSRRADALLVFLPGRGEGRIFRGLWHRRMKEGRLTFSRTFQGRIGARSVLPLVRQDNKGRTTGLYLYHWPSGTALYSPSLSSSLRSLKPKAVSSFPATPNEPLVIPVESREGATRSFVILDTRAGTVWLVLDVRPHPFQPRTVVAGVDLGTLRAPGSSTLSLTAASLHDSHGASKAALVADAVSGRMAVLEEDDDPSRIRLRPLDTTLEELLPGGAGRRLLALPLGQRGGVLLLDAPSGRLVQVVPAGGSTALVRPIAIMR